MPEIFGLYLILTDPVAGYERCAEAAVAEGVRYLQLRIKDRPRAEILPIAQALRAITADSSTRFIVNDDLELAMQVSADGVHVGQSDTPVADVRKRWPGRLVGLSTHDEAQELAARGCEPSYIGVGPVYATPTKKLPDPVLGPQRACQIIRSSPLTTVAIGGIDGSNLPLLLEAGVLNFAVVRAVNLSDKPREAIATLMKLWAGHRSRRAPAAER
jgi:thiamine-phosphate pyrophosphorylase